jgi:S1-C subfamily serine protease
MTLSTSEYISEDTDSDPSSYKRRLRPSGTALLFLGVILVAATASAGGFLSQLEAEVQKLAADLAPSVVTIRAVKSGATGFEATEVYIGTGVVFDKGWVVTTPAVVAAGVKYSVQPAGEVPVPAELVGFDLEGQTAVFRAPRLMAPPAPFAPDSVLIPGQMLLVLGNAYGVETAVSWGIAAGTRDDGLWQIGVNVAPGTSGSPVANSRGEVVGMVLAALSDDSQRRPVFGGSTAMVVPASRSFGIARRIKSEGFIGKAFLGIRPETVDESISRALGLSEGVLIGGVSFGSPAYQADLRAGDVLIELCGSPIRNEADLRRTLANRCPGEVVELALVRDQKMTRTHVQLAQVSERLPAMPHTLPTTTRRGVPANSFGGVRDSLTLAERVQLLEQRIEELTRELSRK